MSADVAFALGMLVMLLLLLVLGWRPRTYWESYKREAEIWQQRARDERKRDA